MAELEISKQSKKFPSLKLKLLIVVTLCWVIPLTLIFSTLLLDVQKNIRRQVREEYSATLSHSASIIHLHLTQAVAASRTASYNTSIKYAYYIYKNSLNLSDLSSRTNSFLASQYQYDEKFLTTALYYQSEQEIRPFYTYNPSVGGSYDSYLYYENNIHEQVLELSKTLGTSVAFINHNGRLYLVRNIVDNHFEPFATITMELNTDYIFSTIENLMWQDQFLLSINDTNFISENFSFSSDKLDSYHKTMSTKKYDSYNQVDGDLTIFGKENHDDINLFYIVNVKPPDISAQLARYSQLLYILILLLAALLVYVFFFAYKNIFNPINRLVKSSHKIESGNFGYQMLPEKKNQEFHYLTASFNHMSQTLKDQFEKIYYEELAIRDARIMALQSQINPHFLNNTLEIINWEARLAGDDKVCGMIESLSTMLHAATNRTSQPLIPLQDELLYVDSYLYIISERFGPKIEVIKDIDSSLIYSYIPRLIMQPIIENAIEHGIQPDRICKVNIRVFSEEEYLIMEISNNSPLTEQDKDAISVLLSADKSNNQYSTKMGIFNVNSRLKIIFGKEFGLTIIGTDDTTIATLKVPLKDTED